MSMDCGYPGFDDIQKTHFADDATLAHIATLERDLSAARALLLADLAAMIEQEGEG
jgi:hypothetical protein